ncbi:MAG: hypothetical protein IKP00_01000 [Victivallales bacterium]|nr:hypothetical protein [Victivallales bacterium]
MDYKWNTHSGVFQRHDSAFAIVMEMQPSPVKPIAPESRRHSAESWEGWTPDNSVPVWVPGN